MIIWPSTGQKRTDHNLYLPRKTWNYNLNFPQFWRMIFLKLSSSTFLQKCSKKMCLEILLRRGNRRKNWSLKKYLKQRFSVRKFKSFRLKMQRRYSRHISYQGNRSFKKLKKAVISEKLTVWFLQLPKWISSKSLRKVPMF